MLWVVHCLDGPDAAEPRERLRAAHSARLKTAPVRALVYGRLMSDDGAAAIGSLLIIDAADRAQVEDFIATDPFTTEGVWQEVRIDAFSSSTNAPIPVSAEAVGAS
ncbi:YciI family protein [Allonocardiopsis opalescens]|uniref:YCII-related domain-containing protein n=1 Tax=Allonocardiopsis opalescens TaxID=1144618 RepID=A0A2T0QAS5_9ACTN|nr:YciI family protein [Allonocardiopsis opalescens]PRY01016.1 hypothetical protein CLV72_102652 [Allonocardiopsis opalescens]